jgi:hypothetical protein
LGTLTNSATHLDIYSYLCNNDTASWADTIYPHLSSLYKVMKKVEIANYVGIHPSENSIFNIFKK